MKTEKPKVLFIIPYVPSLIRTRSYNLIRQFNKRGYPLTLLTVYSGAREFEEVKHIEQAAAQSEKISTKIVTRFELSRTRRYEAWLAGQFDRVLITSQKDKKELLQLVSAHVDSSPAYIDQLDGRIDVLPNGVDEAYFTPGSGPREAETIVFSGKMSYHANIAAATFLIEEVMPVVWAENAAIKLTLVGKDPPPSLRKYQELNPNIEITGTVPDLRVYLRKATAAVVPLVYGAGSQFKVLEAMACGTPVIANPRAVASFEVHPGEDVVVAENPQEIAAAIVAMIADKERQADLGRNGRKLIEKRYGWGRVADTLEDVYGTLIQAKNVPRH